MISAGPCICYPCCNVRDVLLISCERIYRHMMMRK